MRARETQGSPGVGTTSSLTTDSIENPRRVFDTVHGLHRCDDAQTGQATEIGTRQDLGVLDSVAWIATWRECGRT